MDISEILFYGGIAGMTGTVIASVMTILLMLRKKRKLQKQLDSEYGYIE